MQVVVCAGETFYLQIGKVIGKKNRTHVVLFKGVVIYISNISFPLSSTQHTKSVFCIIQHDNLISMFNEWDCELSLEWRGMANPHVCFWKLYEVNTFPSIVRHV